jgi:two-component system, OmpR family, heavy metal sensor histidine kinase CusS
MITATLAGTALIGFGAIAWHFIYAAKVNRLDAKLESQLRRAGRPRPPQRWPAFADTLSRDFGTTTETPIAILVLTPEGTQYQSAQWSAAFEVQSVFSAPPTFLSPPPRRSHLGAPSLRPGAARSFPESPLAMRIVTQRTPTGSWRMGVVSSPVHQVAIAISLQAIDQEMAVIRHIFVITIPGTLVLVAVGAWALAGRALLPIRRLTTTMHQVTATGLDQRVAIGTTDVEFMQLIQVFNQMLERLERSFKQASRFSADAAHELKTPLAILQGELEQTLQQAELGSTAQQRLSHLLDEVHRLSGIVRKLLLLSLADAGQMSFLKTAVNLSEMLEVMVEDLELLAPHLTVQADIQPGLTVRGDRDLIAQILHNLISNAIKYNLPNGWVQIQAQAQANLVQVTLTNASAALLDGDRERLFDRFYRGDPAHTHQVEGIGLGLSLAREIARAHHGTLTLAPTVTGQTTFILTLPKG